MSKTIELNNTGTQNELSIPNPTVANQNVSSKRPCHPRRARLHLLTPVPHPHKTPYLSIIPAPLAARPSHRVQRSLYLDRAPVKVSAQSWFVYNWAPSLKTLSGLLPRRALLWYIFARSGNDSWKDRSSPKVHGDTWLLDWPGGLHKINLLTVGE